MTSYTILLVALLAAATNAAISKGNAGWNDDPLTNYHIQTDEGPERYFRYQTTSGQYRKEKRLEDGTVIGTYGWVDPTGLLLLRDYVADNAGYRIVRTKKVFVGLNSDVDGKSSTPVVSSPKITAAPTYPTIASSPIVVSPASYPTRPTSNLYEHPDDSPIKPQAANFNSHPYYSSEYQPVIGYQKKPVYGQKYQPTEKYQSPLNSYQTPAVYQPTRNYQVAADYQKPIRVYTPEQQAYNDKQKLLDSQSYDGVSTTQNGFRYYLPRQYHEEDNSGSSDRAGSFGYIDPFGIRRVIYYNSSPGSGFQVKKNNRYVGFNATPYDPRL